MLMALLEVIFLCLALPKGLLVLMFLLFGFFKSKSQMVLLHVFWCWWVWSTMLLFWSSIWALWIYQWRSTYAGSPFFGDIFECPKQCGGTGTILISQQPKDGLSSRMDAMQKDIKVTPPKGCCSRKIQPTPFLWEIRFRNIDKATKNQS